MGTRQDRPAIDPDRDGPWQLGDWVWAAICWAVLILCHAAASRVRAAAGLDAAQVILGHRHAQTTEIYAEADRVKAAEIMARVG